MPQPKYTFQTSALEPADYDWPLSAPLKLEIEVQSYAGEPEITSIRAISPTGQPLPSANELLLTHFERQLHKIALDALEREHERFAEAAEESKVEAEI